MDSRRKVSGCGCLGGCRGRNDVLVGSLCRLLILFPLWVAVLLVRRSAFFGSSCVSKGNTRDLFVVRGNCFSAKHV